MFLVAGGVLAVSSLDRTIHRRVQPVLRIQYWQPDSSSLLSYQRIF